MGGRFWVNSWLQGEGSHEVELGDRGLTNGVTHLHASLHPSFPPEGKPQHPRSLRTENLAFSLGNRSPIGEVTVRHGALPWPGQGQLET